METLRNIVFKGKLPFPRIWWRWAFEYALPILLTIALGIGYYTNTLEEMTEPLGSFSLQLLILILFIGPISKIFANIGIFRTLSTFRKELGVGMFYLGLAHSASHLPTLLFYPINALPNYVIFGGIALAITSLLYFTSNSWSIKLLKKYWKLLHKGIYLILILVFLHIFWLEEDPEELINGAITVGALIIVKILAIKKFKILWPKTV